MSQIVDRLLSISLLNVEQVVTGSIPDVYHIFGIVWIFISACLIKQPSGSFSRMCVQAYMRV